jgi:4a-hydroxytetrahydrobiopterin dehydratase
VSPRPPRLSDDELAAALPALAAWTHADGRLHRRIERPSFVEAFALMTSIALVAERLDHHPDWSNAWNVVEITLTTHSAGGLTALDLELARRIDELAG